MCRGYYGRDFCFWWEIGLEVWLFRAYGAGHVCELFQWFKLSTVGPLGLELFKSASVSSKWTQGLGL